MGHARALSKLKDQELCLELADRIQKENLTVRDIEGIIRNINKDTDKFVISSDKLQKAEEKLFKSIDQNIHFRVKKNNIVFKFETEKELNQLVKFLTRKGE